MRKIGFSDAELSPSCINIGIGSYTGGKYSIKHNRHCTEKFTVPSSFPISIFYFDQHAEHKKPLSVMDRGFRLGHMLVSIESFIFNPVRFLYDVKRPVFGFIIDSADIFTNHAQYQKHDAAEQELDDDKR